MAILGFPSSAIIGNLDWTGSSSNLSASTNFVAYGGDLVSIETDGPYFPSKIRGDLYGWKIHTDDEGCFISVGTDATGMSLYSNAEIGISSLLAANVNSNQNVNITATEILNLTGGNAISGGVNIFSGDQSITIDAPNSFVNASAGDTGLLLDGGYAKLSWGAGNYIQVGEEFATIQCGNTIVNGSNSIELNTGGAVLVTGNAFKFNNANVATQTFAIAAAVALG